MDEQTAVAVDGVSSSYSSDVDGEESKVLAALEEPRDRLR